ncbi:endolytic transglycosylase MltG [Microbacterium sulfonylureivorans]|uniref:endolytic transglycosylase MltG n=1 Tax=Microbacterium sulfonylureivorans TaxID=2486854 RepID=UPI000FDC870D|nr:endolytic transglycosylase MltG [Microbacterium sulfonylureivorans]
MPESPSDDPFADLFGKLPDPRERQLRSTGEDAAYGPPKDAAPGTGPVSADGAPLSRRAAREAAARVATGSTPAAPATPAAAPAADGEPPRPTPTVALPALDDSGLLAQPRVSASRPAPGEPDAEEAWIFTDGAAPALPYSRTGSTPQVAPAATAGAEGGARPAATATLEDLFTGASSTDDLGAPPPPKNKRKRRIGGWIALGVVLAIIGGIAAGGWYVWTTYEEQIREVMGWEEPKDYEAGLANGETYITIAPGDTGSPISQSLHEAGVTKTPDAFYDYLIEAGENPPFVPGVFKLQKQMTSEAALAALLDPANKMEDTAQLREGLTVEQSLPLLAEATGIPLEDLQAAVADPSDYGVEADSLEGWLFPATYTFNPGVTAPQVIQTLVDRTVQSLDEAAVPADNRQRVLTVASIIQREARYEADMQKVATVIENRLDPDNQETFGLLQMDSTAQYGYGEMHDGTVSSSEEALNDPNPWNTYVHAGLPVGPISNPGDAAIKAVMNPSGGDWMYFVTVNLDTGETVFTTNLSDHNRAVAQWQEWCSAHPDSGC